VSTISRKEKPYFEPPHKNWTVHKKALLELLRYDCLYSIGVIPFSFLCGLSWL